MLERGAPQRLLHSLCAEGPPFDGCGGQTHAVNRHGVALGQLARERRRDLERRAVGVALDTLNASKVRDQASEHLGKAVVFDVIGRSPLAQARGDQKVIADTVAVEAECTQRLRDALDALALQRIARGPPAEQDRGEKKPYLVDLAGVKKRSRKMWAALQQHRGNPARAKLVERRAHTCGLILTGGEEHLCPGGLQRVGVGTGGSARDADGQWNLLGGSNEL